jgi:hypothetical protein
MVQLNVIEQFSRTLESLENLKRFVRSKQYPLLPEMFSGARKNLISIREHYPSLTEAQNQTFQRSITSFKVLEEKFERILNEKNSEEPDTARILSQISTHTDALHVTLVQIRKQIDANRS